MQDVLAIWDEMDRREKEREEWLRWGRDFRRGRPRERVIALRDMTRALSRQVTLATVLKAFGDPWTRMPPRLCAARGEQREVLCYRHPTDARAQFQILIRDGRCDGVHVVVDEGACQAPSILDVEAYWGGGDGSDRSELAAI